MAYVVSKTVAGKAGKTRDVYLAKWVENGKTREKSFKLKRDAQSFANEMKKAIEEKPLSVLETRQLKKQNFEDAAEDYLLTLKQGRDGKEGLEPHTLRTYHEYLKNHAYPYLAERGGNVAWITEKDIEEIRNRAMQHKNGLSSRSIREILRLTKAVLKYAVKRGYIAAVPGMAVTVARTRAEKTADRTKKLDGVYTPKQIASILLAADSLATDKNKTRRNAWVLYRPLAYFLVHTGVRISEARGFPRKAFDVKKGVVSIRQRAAEEGEIGSTKSIDGVRDIPLRTALLEPMQAALASHKRDLIFSTASGEPMGYSNLFNRMWKPLLARANELAAAAPENVEAVPILGFHALRHAYASRLIAAGVNLKQLSTWLGHNDPAFTLREYGHLFSDDGSTQAVMDRMSI